MNNWLPRNFTTGAPTLATFLLIFLDQPLVYSRPQTPPMRERVWWHPANTSGFIIIDYFLERNISPPITLHKRQSVVQHRKFLTTPVRWHSTFLARKLVIVLNYAYSKLWIFNEVPGISRMSPDPLRTGGVWGQDYPWLSTPPMFCCSVHTITCWVMSRITIKGLLVSLVFVWSFFVL